MIVFLKGTFNRIGPAAVWVDVNGVGYEVNISLHTYSHIQHLKEGILFTHLQIKEDAHSLYGFFDEEERSIFQILISVSGIGANTARMMLSSMKPEEISQHIASGNEQALEKIKGIGAKTAKRIILELRDKVVKIQPTLNISRPEQNNLEQDALYALVSLGIARATAQNALQKTLKSNPGLSLEELIKQTLKSI